MQVYFQQRKVHLIADQDIGASYVSSIKEDYVHPCIGIVLGMPNLKETSWSTLFVLDAQVIPGMQVLPEN